MERREQWRRVLDAELQRWSAKSCDELIAELTDVRAYQVDAEDMTYTVEVQLLENTDTYLHVCLAVDDGSIPASLRPASSGFIQQKTDHRPLTTAH